MTDLAGRSPDLVWREARAAIEGGDPEAIRRAAEDLEALARDPRIVDDYRPRVLYDAGVALELLLEVAPDAAARAIDCQTRAGHMFKDQLSRGDDSAAAGWVDSLCGLTLVAGKAVGSIGLQALNSAWFEADVARKVLGGSAHGPQVGVAYGNLGSGMLHAYVEGPTDARKVDFRDRAIQAFENAIALLASASPSEFEDELLNAMVNRCTCRSLEVAGEADVIRLTECCLETHAWLVSAGRLDDTHAGTLPGGAGCVVIQAMHRGLSCLLWPGRTKARLMAARIAAAQLLLATHPEMWLPLEKPFVDPCVAEDRGSPVEFMLAVEAAYLEIALVDVDERQLDSAIRTAWPAYTPVALIQAMRQLGRDDRTTARFAAALADRFERSKAGRLSLEDQLAERFGKFTAWWCRRAEAPIEQMTALRSAFLEDPDASPEERASHVSLLVFAAANSAGRWSGEDLEVLLRHARDWDPGDEVGSELRLRWAHSRLLLLARLAQSRPALGAELLGEALGARSLVVGAGPPDDDALSLYRDAVASEEFARGLIDDDDGDGPASVAAARFFRRGVEAELAGWGVEGEAAAKVLASLGRLSEDDRDSVAAAVTSFEEAFADGGSEAISRAWRLMHLVAAHEEGDLGDEALTAGREALRLALADPPRDIRRLTGASSLLLRLACMPRLSLDVEDHVTMMELGLRLAEAVAEESERLLQLALTVEATDHGGRHQLRIFRITERIARLVFSSPDNLKLVRPSVCGEFLARQAFAAMPSRGATTLDRSGRMAVAIGALVAACAGDRPGATAVALWAVADHARLFDAGAASAHFARLDELVDGPAAEELPAVTRRAIKTDIAMFSTSLSVTADPEAAPWDPQSTLLWRASRLYDIRGEGEYDEAAVWLEIDQFVVAVEASGEEDEDRASWLLGAAQAASNLGRRGGLDAAVAGRLVAATLAIARSPRVPQTALALPLLELTVLLGVLLSDEDVVRSALVSYRAAVNQRLLLSEDIADTLDRVHDIGAMDEAAAEAFKRHLYSSIEIAESGRAKFLTALAAGLLPASAETGPESARPAAPSSVGQDRLEALVEAALDGSGPGPIAAAVDLLRDVPWVEVVAAFTVPWRSLSHIQELDRLDGSTEPEVLLDLRRAALADPDMGEMLALSRAGRALTWVAGTAGDPQIATLTSDATLLIAGVDAEEPPEFADMDAADRDEFWRQLPFATRRAFNLRAINSDRFDAHPQTVVIDCGADPRVAIQVANGLSLATKDGTVPPIAPSVRLLGGGPHHPQSPPKLGVTILANPTGDLPGALVEACAWAARQDLEPRVLMQKKATVEAFLAALQDSRLVVLSAHGRADQRIGAQLRLADGFVSIDALLRHADLIRAEQVILSCCWGGTRSTSISRRESLGVASSLIALGVEGVVAPVEVVPDLPAGIFGSRMARAYRPDADLGETLLRARIDLAAVPSETRIAEGLEAIERGVSSGKVAFADDAQVAEATAGLRLTTTAELVEVGQSYGLFGIGRRDTPSAP
jgi:hypothetical protein